MGIINLSLDSFSGDGIDSTEQAIIQAKRMISEGADIIDIGGESTRPNSSPITIDQELQRVIPVLKRLSSEVFIPISIDTYKYEVAEQAVEAGASMINDIWGLKYDPRLAKLAAEKAIPIILMSNQRDVSPEHKIIFPDIIATILENLRQSIKTALDSGIPRENIVIDPGLGFGKTTKQNLEILGRLDEMKLLGQPILLASSRKSFLSAVLNQPPEECVEGTLATTAIGIISGVDMVRVHDVKETVQVCKITDAITRGTQ
jgi:dihydropteroate synthase